MGYPRPRPKHLAEKLLQIRYKRGMSQSEVAEYLELKDYCVVSKYELNKNEPPLVVLLAYAKLAGVPVESLIDDQITV
ncbi:MAG TPA: helix-turn-helix transcriptional regulator [Pyrinomonadaceae bacterium]|nr:helix-turn-helix transcriptional regulator [Pyrinomonadaceae bacterium]